ncbi:Rrf2 family transcriptional regulator [Gloeobacter morelensis]|uniref:Rrf2 family transcriptional regulator n=1 Tax=Gloeobacter morelensis MG652769 TaxID=2781736 RepID=A0ABY3PLU3_9CYAN|nr:Rrf2 family transcriptional regulator [Gloeobacter morelensis]UFP94357.1 Rrf2 family transcriptional regulator [Gloeobacter morelensis MG652769]
MPTSSRFAVAVHVLTALSANPEQPIKSEQMAKSASTNPAVIRRIASMLSKAGLTGAQLGLGGGAVLARPASEITLLDVFRAVEEPRLFSWHRNCPDQECFIGRNIQKVLRRTTDRAQAALEAELQKVTIAEVTREVGAPATCEAMAEQSG